MNVAHWAEEHLARFGVYQAVLYGQSSWTNEEIHNRSCRMAGGLIRRGLGPGDSVVISLPPSVDLIVAFMAVLRAGGVAVVVSDKTPVERLDGVAARTSARLVLSSVEGLDEDEPLSLPVERDGEDPAQIVMTSGSLGEPRGVVWSHSTIRARYLQFTDRRAATAQPRRALCALPFSSSFGTQYLYLRLLQKMQLIIPESLEPESLVACIEQHRVQTAMTVPSTCRALLDHPRGDLSSLKSLLVGGSDVGDSLKNRFYQRFKVRLTPVYGMTELGPIAQDGRVLPGLEVRLSADGEVEVRAGSMGARYLGETSSKEWFPTGDLGYFDRDGRLHLTGRSKDVILQGGVTISPGEIEEAVRSFRGVEDCAVVGVPEPFLGEEAVCLVVSDCLTAEQVHRHCRRTLDPHRRPTRIRFCRSIPRNELGKIQRHLLADLLSESERGSTDLLSQLQALSPGKRQERLRELVLELTEGDELDSLSRATLAHRLSHLIGVELPLTLCFNYPPVEPLVEHLQSLLFGPAGEQAGAEPPGPGEEPIAIVGVGCRLAGTDSPEEFWQRLVQGEDMTCRIDRFDTTGSVTDRAALTDIEMFDAEFFGFSPREGRATDPQHRMVLECAWHAVERAGQNSESLSGQRCGVFLGISGTSYSSSDFLGVSNSVAAGRLSHLLNLKGQALAIDTSCSSSLTAVHMAVQGLRRREFDMALVGGVNALCSVDSFLALSRTGVLAPDGRCKTFDAKADGFARGEGCVMFFLKREIDAVRDGNPILALVRGSALNHDGASSTLTAPSGPAQQEVIRAALADAGLCPRDIDYYEAHGTGTALGDPIELESVAAVWKEPVMVGSVKTNIGHLEAAAGAVGLLKAAYLVKSGTVPPQLNFETLNPLVKAPHVSVVTSRTTLGGACSRACVMSMGMSGTNACVIVESPPPVPVESKSGPFILPLSARSREAFEACRENFCRRLSEPLVQLGDFCYTAAVGRSHHPVRGAVVGDDSAELLPSLERMTFGLGKSESLAFLFTGQGAYSPGVGAELYRHEGAFRKAYDECCRILQVTPEVLRGEPSLEQPATFALEYSLYRLWKSWGVAADRVCGHSLGEYVAACVAGVFSLEDGLQLVAGRGRLMDSVAVPGTMISVREAAERVSELTGSLMEVAAVNGPRATVLSGPIEAATTVLKLLAEAGVEYRELSVRGAFHSRLMDPVLDEFRRLVEAVPLKKPALPLVSTCALSAEMDEADYWVQALRKPVRYYDAVRALTQSGVRRFVEVGPDAALAPVTAQCLDGLAVKEYCLLTSLRNGKSERRQMLEALARLYQGGAKVVWENVFSGSSYRRMTIPTYPFQRQSYWEGRPGLGSRARGRRRKPENLPELVNRVVSTVLGRPASELSEETDLRSAGLDSLRLVDLLFQLESVSGARLSQATFLSRPTLRGIWDALESEAVGGETRLLTLREGGDKTPLIFIHPAGGKIAAYLRFLEQTDRPLYALHNEQIPDSIEAAAKEYATLIEKARPSGSVRLFGWSLGGVLAHQTASVLEGAGRVVESVQMVDVPEPGDELNPDRVALAGIVYDHNPKPPLSLFQEADELLSDTLPTGSLLAECERRGWLAEGRLSLKQFEFYLALYRGHIKLLRGYSPATIKADLVACWAGHKKSSELWRASTLGRWEESVIEGDHYSVMREVRLQ